MESETKTFEIGLAMAGAVSAGAYTAGVMDFLIEALDKWYETKEREKATKGKNWSKWTVPPHNVVIKVLSGASAGAMTAAVSAVAFSEDTEPVYPNRIDGKEKLRNKLYSSWVVQADIKGMLEDSDLRGGDASVTSLLNSRSLDSITESAIVYTWRGRSRQYLADVLQIELGVTNLRGVPYSIQLTGSSGKEHHMSAHADHLLFAPVKPEARDYVTVPPEATLLLPDNPNDNGWKDLMKTALASGAFPVALSPRILERDSIAYDRRVWTVPGPAKLVDGQCVSQDSQPVPPDWSGHRPDRYRFLNIDAGVMNNEPLELARRILAGPGGRNERSGDLANRAVIMINPFPESVGFDSRYEPNEGIGNVIGKLFSSLLAQANFKMDELTLARDPNVFSRFVIAPTRYRTAADGMGTMEEFALAGGSMVHFGGFLSETFRRHDFLLGRRNCQRFLMRYFALPIDNPLFDEWPAPLKNGPQYLIERDGKKLLPIIPLADGLRVSLEQPEWPKISEEDIDSIQKGFARRVNLVTKRLLFNFLPWWVRWAAWLSWKLAGRQLVINELMKKIRTDLRSHQLLS